MAEKETGDGIRVRDRWSCGSGVGDAKMRHSVLLISSHWDFRPSLNLVAFDRQDEGKG
jgi:hypothetical protein